MLYDSAVQMLFDSAARCYMISFVYVLDSSATYVLYGNAAKILYGSATYVLYDNIGITHVFSCINICRVPRMLFEHEADRPSVQHHQRDPASVNAMKQTCVIVILAYFTLFQLNLH